MIVQSSDFVLVTTRLPFARPTKENILFLGSWCLDYSDKKDKHKACQVVPYRWNLYDNFKTDFHNIEAIYEKLLIQIALVLNYYHNTKYSPSQWRVVLGPWLSYFITILYDRTSSILCAYDRYKIKNVYILERRDRIKYIPINMEKFFEYMVSDEWNEMIFSDIIKYYCYDYTLIPNTASTDSKEKASSKKKGYKLRPAILDLKSKLRKLIDISSALLANKIRKSDTIFFMSSYLGFIDEIFIQLRCGQFPRFPTPHKFKFVSPDRKDRENLTRIIIDHTDTRKNENEIEGLFWKILPNYIPASYVESFKVIDQEIDQFCSWPKKVKFIVNTCALWNNDDFFKIWCMKRIKEGAKFIIGQHGGHYGIADLNFNENHQIKISHKFLSWGWRKDGPNNIVPFGVISPSFKYHIKPRHDGDILLILTPMPRYSYTLLSAPIGTDNYNIYLEQQFEFYCSLPIEISKRVVIRLFKNPKLDYGHKIASRWLEKFPNVRIDYGEKSFSRQLSECVIGISTYNATSFLETLSINFPTLVYWDDSLWKINDNAKIGLKSLENVGIFHKSALSASRFLSMISSDILGWWFSNRVQEARAKFCYEYARHPRRDLLSILN
jgi:putative transferase (TIGR04331 family)